MQCPKCDFNNKDGSIECVRCGIVFAKYHPHQEPPTPATPTPVAENRELQNEWHDELRRRVFAIPLALVAARLGVALFPLLTGILGMVLHESGHAVSALLCGYAASPGLWFTPISEQQEGIVTLVIVLALGAMSFWGWKTERWYLIVLSVLVFVVHLICRRLPYDRAHALIIFGGDGGALVFGSLLMMTLYAPRQNPIYENSLRWGFLVIGAAGFVDAFHTWTGSEEDIPFGIQEGTQTDPSQLVENYGWTIQRMTQSYIRLAELCLLVLAIVYVLGIFRARKASHSTQKLPEGCL